VDKVDANQYHGFHHFVKGTHIQNMNMTQQFAAWQGKKIPLEQ
jgi:hypothetical protein